MKYWGNDNVQHLKWSTIRWPWHSVQHSEASTIHEYKHYDDVTKQWNQHERGRIGESAFV